jgi:FkbM family methyltransferase
MKLPLVSICLFSMNDSDALQMTMKSLLTQSYANTEILISNQVILKNNSEYHKLFNDPRIKPVFPTANNGFIEHHQLLLSSALGKFFMFANAGDWWHKDFISSCVNVLEDKPDAVLCTTNTSFVKNSRFSKAKDQIDTTNTESLLERLYLTINNTLWSNNAFFSVIRTDVAKEIYFKHRFGFDLFFIYNLSLKGHFVQLPVFYHRRGPKHYKTTIEETFKRLNMHNSLVKIAPGFVFSLQLLNDFIFSPHFSIAVKVKKALPIFYRARLKDPFPSEKQSPLKSWQARHKKRHDDESYQKSLKLTNDHELTLKLFKLNIDPEEIQLDVQTGWLKFLLLNIKIKYPEEISILNTYPDLLKLMYQYDFSLEQNQSNELIANYKGVRFHVSSSNSIYIFKEVFIKKCYNFHLAEPTVVFDVGLNIGLTSLFFSQNEHVFQIYSFELFEQTANMARENRALNSKGIEKIKIFDYGLSNANRKAKMKYSPDFHSVNSSTGINLDFFGVNESDLDDVEVEFKNASDVLKPLLKKHINAFTLLKIDIEGDESEVIANLNQNNMLNSFNAIVLEWHEKSDAKIIDQLSENGFRIYSTRDANEMLGFNTGMIYAFQTGS